jgi:hypothetical protein
MTKDPLKHQFMSGLKERGMTYEEFRQNWKYAGGNIGRHYNYWRLLYGEEKKMPAHADQCLCKHTIKENCYITDGKEFLVVGNCCIKRFMIHKGRTCEDCQGPHRNRADNVCHDCREKRMRVFHQQPLQENASCVCCSKKIDRKYTRCFSCYQRFQEIRYKEHINVKQHHHIPKNIRTLDHP